MEDMKVQELLQYKKLLDEGVITLTEFEEKAELLKEDKPLVGTITEREYFSLGGHMRSMYKKQGDSYIPITPIPNGEEVVSNDENVQQKTKKPISKTTAIIGVIVIFVAFALFLKTTTFKYSSEPIVGEWYCTDVIDLGKASDAANNATLDKDTTLYINADGTYRITRDGEEGNVFIVEANGKWKPMSEENSIKSYSVGDDNQVVMLHCPNGYGTDIRELLFVMNAANSEKGSYTLEYTRVYR